MTNYQDMPFSVVLTKMADDIRSHMILQHSSHADAAALWAVATYRMDLWSIFPKFLINSPDKECGKTTFLELMEAIVLKPVMASNLTTSSFFRFIEEQQPTYLIDEADLSIKNNNQLLSLLNASHRKRGAYKINSESNSKGNWTPKQWSLWTPQVIAGIGQQKDTLMSRSICVNLRRKMQNESVKTKRDDYFESLQELRECLESWTSLLTLNDHHWEAPSQGSDRSKDNWKPLFVVAAAAGGGWIDKAHAAYEQLEVKSKASKSISIGTELLIDIRRILSRKNDVQIKASELRQELTLLEDSEWYSFNGYKGITQKWLSNKLKGYGVETEKTRDANVYLTNELEELFKRYLPPETDG